jgi:polyhydroxybutyrate depolymerase
MTLTALGCGSTAGSGPAGLEPVLAADAGSLDAGAAPAADGGAVVNTPGKWTHRITVDGMEREFIVYVPELAQGAGRAPVVFMFHGTSGDGEKFYNISGWREKADATGLIAVFPSALTYCLKEDENRDGDFEDRGETKVTTKWAAGKLGDPNRMPLCSPEEIAALPLEKRALVDHPLMDDIAFTKAMLAFLGSRYAVDARRIYVSGFSNGASFASRLVLEMSDRFAAAGIAGGGPALPASPVRPMSVVHFFGSEDEKLGEALGVAALPLRESLLTEIPALHDTMIAPFLTMLRLADVYTYEERAVGGEKAIGYTYAQSTAGATNRYRFLVFGGMGHQYPNGTNYPIAAADFLWEVFRTQALP